MAYKEETDTAVEPPKIGVELALAYKDAAGNVVKVDGMYRDERDADPTKLREYFLAAKFADFPAPPRSVRWFMRIPGSTRSRLTPPTGPSRRKMWGASRSPANTAAGVDRDGC